MAAAVRYAYLKPTSGDSPFYLHVTLDGPQRRVRLYWHQSWWKHEEGVDGALLARWHTALRALTPRLIRPKIKARKHSYRVQGRCRVSALLWRDVVGFVEADTQPVLPAKFEGYVNTEHRILEVELWLAYGPLGRLPAELLKLSQVFTANPDYETVRSKLVFFDLARIVAPAAAVVEVEATTEPPEAVAPAAAPPDFAVDPTLDTSDGHPYALPLSAPPVAVTEPTP